MDIIAKLAEQGIDEVRLAKVLAPKADQWGHLVHAFEVLAVLGTVYEAMKESEVRVIDKDYGRLSDEIVDALPDDHPLKEVER